MYRVVIAGFLFVLGISGCTSMKASGAAAESPAPAPATAPATATALETAAQSPTSAPQSPTPANVPPTPAPSDAAKPKPSTVPGPATQTRAATPNRPPAAQTKPKSPAAPPPSAAPPVAMPPAASPSAASQPPQTLPTLNLTDMEQRLRETRAIGVFAKLSLKNQVDDLLSAFRELYRLPNKRPSAELRQRYDLLLLKVLSLLQDGDPPLASAIASSKEAIWSILADPDKFSKI